MQKTSKTVLKKKVVMYGFGKVRVAITGASQGSTAI